MRASGDPLSVAPPVSRELRRSIRRRPSNASRRWPRSAATRWRVRRSRCALLIGFAVTATLLALVGLYGVLTLSVGARRRRLPSARRSARVASDHSSGPRGVSRLVARRAGAGRARRVSLGRPLEALLFDVKPADPPAGGRGARVCGVSRRSRLLGPGACGPALDLMEALRQE